VKYAGHAIGNGVSLIRVNDHSGVAYDLKQ
jgi:hypothetical protein